MNKKRIFSEVLNILEFMGQTYTNKIPKEILNVYNEDCDKEYLNELSNLKTKFEERKYSEDALAVIAYLNLRYWCENEEEKEAYKKKHIQNDIK